MRIVLDENIPHPLKDLFAEPDTAISVQELGLGGLLNGDLLAAIDGRFDVFITADKNLRYQQNLQSRKIAIVELPTNRLPALRQIFEQIANAVRNAKPGIYVTVTSEA
jgi:hypothetical protein